MPAREQACQIGARAVQLRSKDATSHPVAPTCDQLVARPAPGLATAVACPPGLPFAPRDSQRLARSRAVGIDRRSNRPLPIRAAAIAKHSLGGRPSASLCLVSVRGRIALARPGPTVAHASLGKSKVGDLWNF